MKLRSKHIFLLQLLFLALVTSVVYGNFLSNPLVFDDTSFFQSAHPEFQQTIFSFDLRWLPYATIEWTRALWGDNLVWLRLENLGLHIANVLLLFLFLRRLFDAVLPQEAGSLSTASNGVLASSWLAFCGALIFALHPVAVYGVAYLIQRTILMATLGALLTWCLFMEGIIRQQQRWLLASAAAYFLAVLAKEHAIMVPAVSMALLFLLRKPTKQLLIQVWPTFLLYGLVAIFILYQMKSRNILGYAYEPGGLALLSRQGIDPKLAYPLSVLTQFILYFQYCWLWLVPNPHWMSINMLENFAHQIWTWPTIAGLAGFVIYPLLVIRWLLQRGKKGLLGFALLCPWALFATELSTVRIQEIFVLYRSYLWMPVIFAALPFLFQKLQAKYTVAILVIVCVVLVPMTWNRLNIFSDPVLLWDDAVRYNKEKSSSIGLGKIYLNRAVAYAEQKFYPQAIEDFTEAIRLIPRNSVIYNNRATAYKESGQFAQALKDYNIAVSLNPGFYPAYFGRAQIYESMGNSIAALQDYAQACKLGMQQVCRNNNW